MEVGARQGQAIVAAYDPRSIAIIKAPAVETKATCKVALTKWQMANKVTPVTGEDDETHLGSWSQETVELLVFNCVRTTVYESISWSRVLSVPVVQLRGKHHTTSLHKAGCKPKSR